MMEMVLDNKHCTNGNFDIDFADLEQALHQAEVFTMLGFEVSAPLAVNDATYSIRVSK